MLFVFETYVFECQKHEKIDVRLLYFIIGKSQSQEASNLLVFPSQKGTNAHGLEHFHGEGTIVRLKFEAIFMNSIV